MFKSTMLKSGFRSRFLGRMVVTFLSIFFAFSALAQEGDDDGASRPTSSSESTPAPDEAAPRSTVRFRGFQNATEDVPLMSDNWKVSFFQLASVEADRLDDDNTASWFFLNFFSFNYKIDEDSRFAIRPVFRLESPGRNSFDDEVSRWNFTWDDWYINYSRFNMFEIGPFGTRANLRLYAPTSEFSQDAGLITRIRPEFFMETSMGRNSGIEFQFRGDYFFNSKRATIIKKPNGDQIRITNREAEFQTVIEYKYRLNRKFWLKPRIGWFDEWNLSSPENGLSSRHTQDFQAAMGVEIRPNEQFNTTLQYGNQTRIYSNQRNFRRRKMWAPENNEIVALTNYRF